MNTDVAVLHGSSSSDAAYPTCTPGTTALPAAAPTSVVGTERPRKAAAAQIGKAPPGRHYPVYIGAYDNKVNYLEISMIVSNPQFLLS